MKIVRRRNPWWTPVLRKALEFAVVVILGCIWVLAFLGAMLLLAWLAMYR